MNSVEQGCKTIVVRRERRQSLLNTPPGHTETIPRKQINKEIELRPKRSLRIPLGWDICITEPLKW